MSFGTRVEDLIGPVGDDTLITESLRMIGEEIVNAAPIEKLNNASVTAAIPADTGSAGSEVASVGVSVHSKRVLGASKDGFSARLINPEEKARYLSDTSIYRATDVSPVYYLQGDYAFVIATQNVETSGTLRYVPKTPTDSGNEQYVSVSSTATLAFPKEAETLLILGTAVRCLQRLMADATLPSEVSIPVLEEITESLPTFVPPDAIVMPASLTDADIDFSSVPGAPSFTKPTLSLPVVPTIADLSITAQSPVTPIIDYSTVIQTLTEMVIPPDVVLPTLTLDSFPGVTWNFPSVPVSPVIADTELTFTNDPPTYASPVSPVFDFPIVTWTIPTAPVLPEITQISYSGPSSAIETSVIDDVEFTAMAAGDIFSGSAPTYTNPLVNLTDAPSVNWTMPQMPVTPVFDFSEIVQDVSEMIMPSGIILPSLEVSAFPSGDISWDTPTMPVAPVIDWSVVYQVVQDIVLPAKIILPDLKFTDPEAIVWAFPTPPVQPELSYAEITQTIDTINLPAEIVLPSLAIPDAPDVTWNFPGEPVQAPLDWGDLESWIEGEDSEMANTRINAVQAQVQSYQGSYSAYGTAVNAIISRNQGKINTWGDEWKTKAQVYSQELNAIVDKYRGESQGKQSIVNAQVAARNSQVQEVLTKAQATVSLYQAKVSVYQAQVNAEIQQNQGKIRTWADEWQTKAQKFVAEIGAKVQKYSAEAGGEAKVSQAQIAVRSQQLQEVLTKSQTEVSVYQAKVQGYQTEVATIAQKNKSIAQNWQIEWGTKVQNFSIETSAIVTKYQGEIGGQSKAVQAQVAVLQGQIQEATSKNSANLEVYKAAVQGYQTDVSAIIQKNGAQIAAWKQENTMSVQKYSSDIQNNMNLFQKDNVAYQASLKESMAEFQVRNQGYVTNLQADLQIAIKDKDRDQQRQLQNAINNMQSIITDNQSKIALFSSNLQTYGLEVGNIIKRNQAEVGVFVQKEQLNISIYQGLIQDELNKFKALNTEFQVDLQVAIQSAQLSSRDSEMALKKFQSELQAYNTEVSSVIQQNKAEISAWQAEWSLRTQNFTAEVGAIIEKHKANIASNSQLTQSQVAIFGAQIARVKTEYDSELQKYQGELQKYKMESQNESQEYVVNELQKELGIWKNEMQGVLAEYSAGIQNEGAKLGAEMGIYSTEIGRALKKYQAESGYDTAKFTVQLQAESQKFQSDLRKNTDTFRTSLEKYRSELQKVSMTNQTKLAKYGADIQGHNAKIQKEGMDYQWKMAQYQQLRGEYMQGLQLFMKVREDVMNLEQKRRR